MGAKTLARHPGASVARKRQREAVEAERIGLTLETPMRGPHPSGRAPAGPAGQAVTIRPFG